VLEAFDGLPPSEDGLDQVALAAHGDDLQAVVVIQVHVLRGDDGVVAIMLDVGKSLQDVALMVVEDDHDSAGDLLAPLPFRPYQAGTDQVAHGLGSGRTAPSAGCDLTSLHRTENPGFRSQHPELYTTSDILASLERNA